LKRDFGAAQHIEMTHNTLVYTNLPGNETARSGFGESLLKVGAQSSVSDYISFMGTTAGTSKSSPAKQMAKS
jgi:hypothetical protein